MRFKIHLKIKNRTAFLPVDYQYLMSSAVYKLIKQGDEDYSNFLHDEGFSAGGLKRFKLFTFSPLRLPKYKLWKEKGVFELLEKETSFIVSFMADRAAEAFVKGMFQNQQFSIGDRFNQVDVEVSMIEAMPQPLFLDTMEYQSQSPIVIKKKEAGKKHDTYLVPDHPEFGEFLINNLISKAMAFQIASKEYAEKPFDNFCFELLGDYKNKLIKIRPYTPEETQVKGSLFRFRLTAPSLLQEIGYYAGFGVDNGMGFGFGEVVNN